MPPSKPRRSDGRNTASSQLRELIRSRGLSASRLGQLADVDRRMIARFIAGQRSLNFDSVDRIASALGLRWAETPGRKSARQPAPSAPDPRSVFEVIREDRTNDSAPEDRTDDESS